MWVQSFAVVSTLALAIGCKPTQPREYSGSAQLTFVRATPTQLQFRISNQSRKAVRFRGSRGDELGADPWDFLVECKAAESTEWEVLSPGVTDGNYDDFEVAPGEQLLIRVSSDFANHYANGRCRVTLWARDKVDLMSDEFAP